MIMIENYFNAINQFLSVHPYLAQLFVLIVAFTESLPLIGTIVPGSFTMTAIGVLIGRGMVPGLPTLLLAVIGALAGDTLGFWIGKYYNEGLRSLWPFNKHPKWLTLGEDFFNKHGGKSILIGRFVGPVRSSVPLIAGLLKMSWPRFFLAATPSAILWAVAYLLPGVLIGAISLELPPSVTTRFVLISLAVIILLWLIFWAIQQFFIFLTSTINRLIDRLWSELSQHAASKPLIRMLTNQRHPKDHQQLTLLLLALLSLVLFVTLLLGVVLAGPLTAWNAPVFHFLQSLRTHPRNNFFVICTLLGQSTVIYSIGLITAAGLIWKKAWRACAHLLVLLFLTGAAVEFFKWALYSPRPTGLAVAIVSSSFPSGHMTSSLTLLGFLAFLTTQQLQRSWHWVSYTTASVLIAFIGFSRLYLGAHWFTDIVGGIFLGFTLLLSIILSYRRRLPTPFGNSSWIVFTLLAVLIPWGSYSAMRLHTTASRYALIWPTQTITWHTWWENPTQYLPIYRLNRLGHPIEPFNVQWAQQRQAIEQRLIQRGWTIIQNEKKPSTALNHFVHQPPEQRAPFFPLLYRNQPPILFAIKYVPKQMVVQLHLWATGIIFNDNASPLWIGSIDYRILPSRLSPKKKRQKTTIIADGLGELIKDLQGYSLKTIRVSTNGQPKKITPLKWDGTILIVRSSGAL